MTAPGYARRMVGRSPSMCAGHALIPQARLAVDLGGPSCCAPTNAKKKQAGLRFTKSLRDERVGVDLSWGGT